MSLVLPMTGSDYIYGLLSIPTIIHKDSEVLNKVILAFMVVEILKKILVCAQQFKHLLKKRFWLIQLGL